MKNYGYILDILAEKLKEKDSEITLLKWQIEALEKRLKDAEKHTEIHEEGKKHEHG